MRQLVRISSIGLAVTFLLLAGTARAAQIVTTVSGQLETPTTGAGDYGDGSTATSATHKYTVGVQWDSSGNMYVADYSNRTVRKVDKTTGIITTVAGQRGVATAGDCSDYGEGVDATAATLGGPADIDFDSAGNMYILDRPNNTIRKVDKSTNLITTVVGACKTSRTPSAGALAGNGICLPWAIIFDSQGRLLGADACSNVIFRINAAFTTMEILAGTPGGHVGGHPYINGGAATSAKLYTPDSLALDSSGNIYLTDRDHSIVRKITTSTGIISTIAGIYNSPGDSGAGWVDALSAITKPSGIAVTPDGSRVYFSEQEGACTIRELNTDTGKMIRLIGAFNDCTATGDGAAAVNGTVGWVYGMQYHDNSLYWTGSSATVRKLAFTGNLAVTTTGTGKVTSSPSGVSCPGTCTAEFLSGATITLTAKPVKGSTWFEGWTGACAAFGQTRTCTLTGADELQSVGARFRKVYVPTVGGGGSGGTTGTASGDGGAHNTATITNSGSRDAKFAGIVSVEPSDVVVTSTTCLGPVVPGASCTVELDASASTATEVTITFSIERINETVSVTVRLPSRTGGAPLTLLQPEDEATVGTDALFEWRPVGGEGTYQLYLCDNPDFTGCEPVEVTFTARIMAGLAGMGGGALFLFGFLLRRPGRSLLMLALLLTATGTFAACGGSGSSGTTETTVTSNQVLTPGTYYWKVVSANGVTSETRTVIVAQQ